MFRNFCILSLFVLSAHQAAGVISPTDFIDGGLGAAKHIIESGKNCLSSVGVAASQLTSVDGAINAVSCGAYCALHGIGILKNDGTLNGDFIKKVNLGPFQAQVDTIIAHCSNKANGNQCKSTKATLECILHEGIVKNVGKHLISFLMPVITSAMG